MKKKFIIAVVAIIIVASLVATATFMYTNDGSFTLFHEPGEASYDYRQGANIIPGKYFDPVYNDVTGDFRPIYEEIEDIEYEWYFSELPEFPQDFFTKAKLVYDGKITDYSRLGEEYWKQPEFYPAWFNVFPNSSYVDYNPEQWTPEGYGCYPSIKEVSTKVKGRSINVDTYFRTGFATHAYQGIIVRPYIPEYAVSVIGNPLFENPEDASKYIKVRITNPDDELYEKFKDSISYSNVKDEDWMTILKPTHALLYNEYAEFVGEAGFPDDWVRRLNVEITLADNIPNGDYCIGVKVYMPCFEINQEYYFHYGAWYFPGGRYQITGRPHFQIIMHVED